MSFYSITESNINKPSSSDFLNYQKLSKLNKFYLSNNNFTCKYSLKSLSIKKPQNKRIIFNSSNFLTPNKGTKRKSYNYLNNTTKVKNKFNPDILDTHFISQPKKQKKITHNIAMPKYNSFLYKKIKLDSLHSNMLDFINRNKHNLIRTKYCKKPLVEKKIFSKKKVSISDSMNLLIERANRSNKKAASYMIQNFDKKLIFDKRENLKEYNKFMNALQTNLNKSKSKSKICYRFFYE